MPKASPQLSSSTNLSQQASSEDPLHVGGGSSTKLFATPTTTPPRAAAKARKPADLPTSGDAERDLQLMRVIDAWPALSPRARAAVVAVVEASCQR
jgi:hypothetical protein